MYTVCAQGLFTGKEHLLATGELLFAFLERYFTLKKIGRRGIGSRRAIGRDCNCTERMSV